MGVSKSAERKGSVSAALKGVLGQSLRVSSPARPSDPRTRTRSISDRTGPDCTGNGVAQDAVNSVIEGEIFPAILSAPNMRCAKAPAAVRSISREHALDFAKLPLEVEPEGLIKEVKALLDTGIPVNAVYDELLAPAARSLGQMWEEDSCDFVDVTMGLWRLQEVMREISAWGFEPSATPENQKRKAVFFPMPGDQHFMGPQMLEDVFTRAGWNALAMTQARRTDIIGLLSMESFNLVALTLSRDCPSAAVRNIIDAMRLASRNPDVVILVGGRMINHNPAVVAEVGADGTGADARAALDLAERLLKSAKVHAHLKR